MAPDPRLEVLATPDAAAARAAEIVAAAVRDALDARGTCHLALAGGSTPVACYERLGPLVADWHGVHLWLGDERCVPPDHPESNGRLVHDRLDAPGARLHRPPPDAAPDAQARTYGAELSATVPAGEDAAEGVRPAPGGRSGRGRATGGGRAATGGGRAATGGGAPGGRAGEAEVGDGGPPVLDLVLLGLGPDGHTCSLFPGHPALTARAPVVAVLDAPSPPERRVTLTRPVLDAARLRLVLTTGAGKAPAVARALGPPGRDAPVSLLRRSGTTVLVDRAAAGELPEDRP